MSDSSIWKCSHPSSAGFLHSRCNKPDMSVQCISREERERERERARARWRVCAYVPCQKVGVTLRRRSRQHDEISRTSSISSTFVRSHMPINSSLVIPCVVPLAHPRRLLGSGKANSGANYHPAPRLSQSQVGLFVGRKVLYHCRRR